MSVAMTGLAGFERLVFSPCKSVFIFKSHTFATSIDGHNCGLVDGQESFKWLMELFPIVSFWPFSALANEDKKTLHVEYIMSHR